VEAWPLPRVLVWSGTLGADLFEPHPMTWLAPGHAALRTWCDARRPGLEAGGARVLFLPHARHVLNDAQSTLSFLLDRAGQPFDVVLSTDALLEPSMLDDVEDHVERMHAALGDRSVAILGGPLPGAAG
ncbi:MAG: hypothetical protein KDA25_08200, partial [Phycisphaerales bacterium]|nr:hypothetical protein [Phycisphaerales bacterium]